jgi:hypothetical protein
MRQFVKVASGTYRLEKAKSGSGSGTLPLSSFWYLLQAQIRQLEKAKSMGVLNPGALGLLGSSSLVTGSDIELETQVVMYV